MERKEDFMCLSEEFYAGETFQVSYTATLNTKEATAGLLRSLPAVITFQNSSEISGTTYKIVAPFSLTAKEISNLKSHQINRGEKKESPAKSSNSVPEDLTGFDRLIDILCFEEAENLLQALEDSEIGNMTQADAYLEACRVQVYKDVTGILLRNMTEAGNLSPLEEKRMNMILSGHWTDLQKRTQEEHRRKLVALTAECNLDRWIVRNKWTFCIAGRERPTTRRRHS
ncbi:unnamed protein product [Ranitomeya imitator]|uniref:Uncharacterized protein n=1 Tax=Ranitomeya imitator TaxID=111125 RepID=A0ABN9M3H1_9NEOB|nr:unnamed protein product [Ranitomeya imitator]